MKYLKSISAELIKLRYMPIISLSMFAVVCIWVILFSAHYLDVNHVAQIGINPWGRILDSGMGVFAVFISMPYLILLISAAVFLEYQSDAWKFLYTTPTFRSTVFYGKLSAILIIVVFAILLLNIGLLGVGMLLDFFLPELEFQYYTPDLIEVLKGYFHVLLGSLGVIGIQYFLSHRFKGFLVPASFGVLAFVVGIIIGAMNNSLAHLYPYAFPIVVKDFNMFKSDNVGVRDYNCINSIELYSIVCFIFFVGLANILESRKRIV